MGVLLLDEYHASADLPVGRGYCPYCGKNVDTASRDFGIGAFEYWGSKGVHRDLQDACVECGEITEPERAGLDSNEDANHEVR